MQTDVPSTKSKRLPKTLVNTGKLDFLLLRPMPLPIQIISYKIDFDGIINIIIASIIFIISKFILELTWNFKETIIICILLFVRSIIRICLVWCANCSVFWFESSKSSFGYFIISLGEATKYPITIYPQFLQGIFKIIPYAFINYYPVIYIRSQK